MNTADIGHKAEAAATVYLGMRGYKILEQNWRRPRYEIDIVAEKDTRVYFVEVKYRFDDEQGGGLDAITKSKLQHMERAAKAWVQENKWRGEFCLAAIEIAGPTFAVLSFIDNVF